MSHSGGDPVPRSGTVHRPLRPIPTPSVRPWAGERLGPPGARVGELWLAGPDSLVDDGPGGSATLEELAGRHGEALVGTRGMALLGPRFPLLAKVIDAADWLSLQVHPDDALARELYGPEAVGKTEAWLVVEAAPGTRLVTGPRAGLTEAALRSAITGGTMVLDDCTLSEARPGDTWLIEAGTIHAIGAGTFVYEIEQPSDLTFRISDWGRPTGRVLHVRESLRAIRHEAHAVPAGRSFGLEGGALEVPMFRLELLHGSDPMTRRPAGRTPDLVTVLRGDAVAHGSGWTEALAPLETIVVPAAISEYVLELGPDALAAVGSLP